MSLMKREVLRVKMALMVLDLSPLWVIPEHYQTMHWYAILIIWSHAQSHQRDPSIRIHIIATYAVHARLLLCKVAPPTKESIYGACLLVYFPSLHVLPTGKQAGTSLPSSHVPHLWVVCSGVVASWWPGFTLHCTGEGECVKQNPHLSPVWFHWGSEHDHSD